MGGWLACQNGAGIASGDWRLDRNPGKSPEEEVDEPVVAEHVQRERERRRRTIHLPPAIENPAAAAAVAADVVAAAAAVVAAAVAAVDARLLSAIRMLRGGSAPLRQGSRRCKNCHIEYSELNHNTHTLELTRHRVLLNARGAFDSPGSRCSCCP